MRPGFGVINASVAAAFALLVTALAAAQTETPAGVGVVIRLDKRFDALGPVRAAIE